MSTTVTQIGSPQYQFKVHLKDADNNPVNADEGFANASFTFTLSLDDGLIAPDDLSDPVNTATQDMLASFHDALVGFDWDGFITDGGHSWSDFGAVAPVTVDSVACIRYESATTDVSF